MRSRPAETAGATVGVAGIVAGIVAHDPLAAALAVAGLVPGAVTLLVANGGVRGAVRLLWRGRDRTDVAVVESSKKRKVS